MRKIIVLTIFFTAAVFAQGNPALDFDGSDDYVDCGSGTDLQMGTHDLTVEFWLKTSASAIQRIIGNGGTGSTDDGYSVWTLSNGRIRAQCSDATNTVNEVNTNTVNDGNWHHVAVMYDRDGNLTVCIDGACSTADLTSVTGNCDNSSSFVLGVKSASSNTTQPFTGILDEVRIWSAALSEATFEEWMYKPIESGHTNYANLEAYYQMSDGSGTTLTDNSTNNNIGTLTNMDDDDWVASTAPVGCTISGNSGFRMMSSPVDGQIYSDLLAELWTQGMTGADVTSGSNNVWTYSGSGWTDVTDISGSGSGASLTAGQGFLVYVFANTDGLDDDSDLPVTLSVAGTENSATVTRSTTASEWNLLGNPFASTIDADQLFTDNSNYTSVVYVYDHSTDSPTSPDVIEDGGVGIYRIWNTSTGSLSDGLIAPYQGFWIQSGASGTSFAFTSSCKSASAGTFYKTMADNTGSMNFTITSGEYSNKTFVSFMTNGAEGMDNADAYKLLPMSPSERVVGISYAEGNGLDISNLPYSHDGSISIPLDVMYLTVDDDYNFVTNENDVSMAWDISSLPGHVSLTLTDNATGTAVNLTEESEITFQQKRRAVFLPTALVG